MNRKKWFWSTLCVLPLVVAGVVYANSHSAPYICPLTGEELPCEKCCPLNQAEGYTCPLTGEQLPCPKCCPLNR
jgi:hypothetical protein